MNLSLEQVIAIANGGDEELDALPITEHQGKLWFKNIVEEVAQFSDQGVPLGTKMVASQIPMLGDYVLYPLVGANGLENFVPYF